MAEALSIRLSPQLLGPEKGIKFINNMQIAADAEDFWYKTLKRKSRKQTLNGMPSMSFVASDL